MLACPSGERHDVGLLCFGLALRGLGLRVTFVGADTPLTELVEVVRALEPDAVVVACTMPARDDALKELRALALLAPTAIGGPGASEQLARHEGVALLPCDVIEAAAALSRHRKQTGRPVQ